jgi:hypothetical protein
MMGVFTMIVLIVAISAAGGVLNNVAGGAYAGVPVIVIIVAIGALAVVMREFARKARDVNRTSRRDLEEIKQRMSQMEADIGDIKEQIADFIINQV